MPDSYDTQWVPANPDSGAQDVTVTFTATFTDGTTDVATQTMRVQPNSVPIPPVIPQFVARVGETVRFVLPESSGGDGRKTTALDHLPPGMEYNPATRTITGTAAVGGDVPRRIHRD